MSSRRKKICYKYLPEQEIITIEQKRSFLIKLGSTDWRRIIIINRMSDEQINSYYESYCKANFQILGASK